MLCIIISHYNTIHYSATAITHIMAFEAGQSSQGTFEPITPVSKIYVLYRTQHK